MLPEMKTFTTGDTTFEVVDGKAREGIEKLMGEEQSLTGVQKAQVRANVGLSSGTVPIDELTELWEAVAKLQSAASIGTDYPAMLSRVAAWYTPSGNTFNRRDVTEVRIVREYTPTGNEDQSWNGDANSTGAIRCYRTGSVVTISSEGAEKIRLQSDAKNLFANFYSVTKITGLEIFDASEVTTLNGAFANNRELEHLDISSWHTPKLENIGGLCAECYKLKTFKGFYYGIPSCFNRERANSLFQNCYELSEVELGRGLPVLGNKALYKCLNLEKVSGAGSVTTIGEQACTYTPKLVDIDLNSSIIESIGADSCRLSSLEDGADLSVVPVDAVGLYATRRKRWTAEQQDAINSVVIPKYVYLEVPNPDNQSNYTFDYAKKDGEMRTVALSGCPALTIYHEYQAIHKRYGGKIYNNFKEWWDELILARDPDFANNHDLASALNDIRAWLGWTYNPNTDKQYVTSEAQMQFLVERLMDGLPTYASFYSSNTVDGLHAGLIIGVSPESRKFAILDPNVIINSAPDNTPEVPGTVSWLGFEDIFCNDTIRERICPTTSYDVPTV